MANKELAIEALMRELAVSELRLVPCMNEKVKDVGELCKSILELVDKSASSPLKYAEKFALFHILARQMFKSELHSNPEFEEVCKFLVSYFMVKSMEDWEKMSAELDIAKKWDTAMGEPVSDPKYIPCVVCGEPMSKCKCKKPSGYG